jgi:hypothetical protein
VSPQTDHKNFLRPVGVWTEEDQRREEAVHRDRWKEACEEKLHDLAIQISPEEVDGGVVDADIVLAYLKGEYDEPEIGFDRRDENTGLPPGFPA